MVETSSSTFTYELVMEQGYAFFWKSFFNLIFVIIETFSVPYLANP